jgi:heme exporter protein D
MFYAGTGVFALWKGGAPERIAVIVLAADFELSHWFLKPFVGRYSGVEWSVFAIDTIAFLGLYILSLLTTRYWPIWMAAVQGCVAMSHLTGLRADVIPTVYGNFVVVWSYVLLIILIVATIRHRTRLARDQNDPAWSWHSAGIQAQSESCDDRAPSQYAATSVGNADPG